MCLFGPMIITDYKSLNAQTGLKQVKPVSTQQIKLSNGGYIHTRESEQKSQIGKTFVAQSNDYTVMSNKQQVTNKYSQIGNSMGYQSVTTKIQMKDQFPKNVGYLPRLLSDSAQVNNVYLNDKQLHNKSQYQNIQNTNGQSFEVSGSVDYPVVQDYQDFQFMKAKNKFFRSAPISMALSVGSNDNSFKRTRNFSDQLTLEDYSRLNKEGIKFNPKDLPYPMNGLEPVFSEDIMNYHYDYRHHLLTFNSNELFKEIEEVKKVGDLAQIQDLLRDIKHNVGSHLNYTFFWECFCPMSEGGGAEPSPITDLGKLIDKTYGSFNAFQYIFLETFEDNVGQTWSWLCYNKKTEQLEIRITDQHEIMIDKSKNIIPLFAIDAWVNSQYQHFQNDPNNYTHTFWKIINWKKVAQRLADCKAEVKA